MAKELEIKNPDMTLDDEIKLKQLELLNAQLADIEAAKRFREAQTWEIELKKAEEAERLARKELELERLKNVHASMAKDTISSIAVEEKKQKRCSHLNMRGESDCAGSLDYNNKLILICQACQKSWNEAELGENFPFHLVHPTRQIGSFGAQ